MPRRKKDPEVKQEEELKLTESEYFSLESYDHHMAMVALQKKNKSLEIEKNALCQKIVSYQLEDLKRNQRQMQEELQSLEQKKLNLEVSKKSLSADIGKRLGLEGKWGFDPETLIVIPE